MMSDGNCGRGEHVGRYRIPHNFDHGREMLLNVVSFSHSTCHTPTLEYRTCPGEEGHRIHVQSAAYMDIRGRPPLFSLKSSPRRPAPSPLRILLCGIESCPSCRHRLHDSVACGEIWLGRQGGREHERIRLLEDPTAGLLGRLIRLPGVPTGGPSG